jgi:hypothetical protein
MNIPRHIKPKPIHVLVAVRANSVRIIDIAFRTAWRAPTRLLVEVKREELASHDVRSFGRPQNPSAASVSRVRRMMVLIRPGARAAVPNIKLRPPLLLARPEMMLASRMGLAVSCRAAAR